MDLESDIDSSSSSDDGSESGEESSSSGGLIIEIIPDFNWVMDTIRRAKTNVHLIFRERDVLQDILENIDEFCEELSTVESASYVNFGFCHHPLKEKLDITPDNAAAWNKFFDAVGALAARFLQNDQQGIETFVLGCHCGSLQVVTAFLRVLPAMQNFDFYLPWHGPRW